MTNSAAKQAAMASLDEAMRATWPAFYHRNLAPDVRRYFEAAFPIAESDRHLLAERYLTPVMQPGTPSEAPDRERLIRVSIWLVAGLLVVLVAASLIRSRSAHDPTPRV
jgi:hypothetical protein